MENIPLFNMEFQCRLPNDFHIREFFYKNFRNVEKLAVKVIDHILIEHTEKDTLTSKNVVHNPTVYYGNSLFGYTKHKGKVTTSFNSQNVITASNKSAYLVKIIALGCRRETTYYWDENVDKFLINNEKQFIIITPDLIFGEYKRNK